MAGDRGYKRRITLEFNYDEVTKGTKSVANQMKILNAEYKASKAEANMVGDATDKLGLRHQYLQQRIKIVNAELETNYDRLKKAIQVQGEGSKAAEKYGKEVSISEANLKKLQIELETVNRELEKNKEFLGKTAEEWDEYADKIGNVGETLTKRVSLPLAAMGAAAFKLAADYEQAVGKMEVVFGDSSAEIEAWAQNAFQNFGLAKSSAIAMAADFGAMANSLQISGDKAKEMSMGLAERVRDLSAFYNVTSKEAAEALNAIFTGASQPLRKFGVVMTEAALNSYALSQGIKKTTKEMSEAEKVQLRYNYVVDATNQAVGQFKREQNDASTQLETFKEVVKELGVNFGEVLLPMITPVLQAVNKGIKYISQLDDSTKKFIVTVLTIVATLGPFLIAISKIIKGAAAVSKGIKGVSRVGAAFGSAASASRFFGFAKWLGIIIAIVGAITLLIAAIAAITGKSSQFINTMNSMRGAASSFNKEAAKAQRNAQKAGSHAVGTNYVQGDQMSLIHEGEAIIPADQNPWNPSAQNNLSDPFQGGIGGGNIILNVSLDEVGEVQQLIRTVQRAEQYRRAGLKTSFGEA